MFLRSELETRSEEIRRRDHILDGLLQELNTIKALVPGEILDAEEPSAASPELDYAPVDVQEDPGRVDPPEMTNETSPDVRDQPVPAQATGWRAWWRRVIGHVG